MVLYVWINNYKSLKNIGFNLTSKYKFDFDFTEKGNEISGELTCKEISSSKIFNEYFWDLKTLIGKNGTGKSSMIYSTIQSILTDHPMYFNGFIVTDKNIFNRRGINIKHDFIIDSKKLIEIKNADICNFHRLSPMDKMLNEEEAKNQKGYRIIDSYLSGYSLFYFSPLINYDRVYESEDIVAGHQIYEVDYFRFFDISTESQIVLDSNNFSPFDYLDLKSGSELLCHKSKESERIIEYLLTDETTIPFKINIPEVTIHLNQFSINFWQSVTRQFKSDNQSEAPLFRIIDKIELSKKNQTSWDKFEGHLLKNFLFFALKHEVNHKYNVHSENNKGNAITDTILSFETTSKKQKSLKGLLKNYLTKSDFFKKNYSELFNQVNEFILFLKKEHKEKNISVHYYSFDISFSNKEFLNKFLQMSYSFYGYREQNKKYETLDLGFSIFSYEFPGLSSGEKSFLHMLSRFDYYFKRLSSETKEIVLFLDEPDVGLHPQWQKKLITIICTFFKDKLKEYKVQIILTGHSPIIISDLPNENIVFLDLNKDGNKTIISKLDDINNTFAANIHALYADAFFIQEGTIGDFAKKQINKAIEIIKEQKIEEKDFAAKIINLVGDDLIRQRLHDFYIEKFGTQPETVEEEITRLERELEYAKSKKDENR